MRDLQNNVSKCLTRKYTNTQVYKYTIQHKYTIRHKYSLGQFVAKSYALHVKLHFGTSAEQKNVSIRALPELGGGFTLARIFLQRFSNVSIRALPEFGGGLPMPEFFCDFFQLVISH